MNITTTTIAFIGLGHMGGPMAVNLAKAGYPVRVFDLVPAALDAATTSGAKAAASAAEAVEGAAVVISMLPASRHVEGLYLGDGGLLETISQGALVIDVHGRVWRAHRGDCANGATAWEEIKRPCPG